MGDMLFSQEVYTVLFLQWYIFVLIVAMKVKHSWRSRIPVFSEINTCGYYMKIMIKLQSITKTIYSNDGHTGSRRQMSVFYS